jgi:hypothetical protein
MSIQVNLTQQQLEAHLWGAANILRGKTAGQDYKNYILSLMFYKRLCDHGSARRMTPSPNWRSSRAVRSPSNRRPFSESEENIVLGSQTVRGGAT